MEDEFDAPLEFASLKQKKAFVRQIEAAKRHLTQGIVYDKGNLLQRPAGVVERSGAEHSLLETAIERQIKRGAKRSDFADPRWIYVEKPPANWLLPFTRELVRPAFDPPPPPPKPAPQPKKMEPQRRQREPELSLERIMRRLQEREEQC